jgi:uncharacterized membrane protein YqjE
MAFSFWPRPRALAAALADYAQARLALLEVEAKDAGRGLLLALTWGLIGLAMVVLAYALLLASALVIWVRFGGGHWANGALVLGLLHAAVGCWILSRVRRQLGRLKGFEETRRQLKEDHACLSPDPQDHD